MPARPIEDTPTSPYAILGVSRYASEADIKRAYRDKAKLAHPDAGGSVDAMARVNQAYTTLSDPAKRSSYDAATGRPTATATYQPAARHRAATPAQPAEPAQQQYDPPQRPPNGSREHHEHLRRRWARSSALEIARISLLFVGGLSVLTAFFGPQLNTPPAFFVLFGMIVLPMFSLLFGLSPAIDPALRLAIYDFSPRYRMYPTEREWRAGRRILAAAVLLSIGWAWMMTYISTPA